MRHFIVLWLVLIATISLHAQAPITPENASKLQRLVSVGSALSQNLAYSPDGAYLLASTTDNTVVYQADDLSVVPQSYPPSNLTFEGDALIIGDQLWDLDSGDVVGNRIRWRVLSPSIETPNSRLEITRPDGEIITLDMGAPVTIRQIRINPSQTTVAILLNDTQNGQQSEVRLYRLSDGGLYAQLPQLGESLEQMIFIPPTDTAPELLLVETFIRFEGTRWVHIYESETGELKTEYSGMTYTGAQTNADNSVIAYDLDAQRLIIYSAGVFSSISEGIEFKVVPLGQASSLEILYPLTVSERFVVLEQAGGRLNLYSINEAGIASEPLIFSYGDAFIYGDSSVTNGRWLLFYDNLQAYLWDLTAPEAAPQIIPLQGAYYPVLRVSPDGSRLFYQALSAPSRLIDLTTQRVLVEMSEHAMLNPAWSDAAYWEHGDVIVMSFAPLSQTRLNTIAGYAGRVADLNVRDGEIVFIAQTLQLFDVDSADPYADAISSDLQTPVPHKAQFIQNGDSLIVSQATNSTDILSSFSRTDPTPIDGFKLVFWGEYTLSPQGNYIVGYDNYCDYIYGNVFTYVTPVTPSPNIPDDAQLFEIYEGCRADSFAFNQAETILYITGNGRLLQVDLTDPATPQQEPIAYYPTADEDYALIRGVALSPDERLLALGIEIYRSDTFNHEANAIEILRVADLQPNGGSDSPTAIMRLDGVRHGRFSPDSQLLVTEGGLYRLTTGLLNPAISGMISAFTPDSTMLATYQNGEVLLWDVMGAAPVARYAVSDVQRLAFSPDSTRLYVVRGGEVQVWGIGD